MCTRRRARPAMCKDANAPGQCLRRQTRQAGNKEACALGLCARRQTRVGQRPGGEQVKIGTLRHTRQGRRRMLPSVDEEAGRRQMCQAGGKRIRLWTRRQTRLDCGQIGGRARQWTARRQMCLTRGICCRPWVRRQMSTSGIGRTVRSSGRRATQTRIHRRRPSRQQDARVVCGPLLHHRPHRHHSLRPRTKQRSTTTDPRAM